VIEYLQKEMDMKAIYQFELKGMELLDVESTASTNEEFEE